ncbi:TOM1 protein [Drechmeria coniospora]|uniref:HECT-type E3 ubiquitin transferase n=1 Tax=Drechmeria coniospora TaxID=98403 RepID=A0A151GVT5_DRECN|nr:TOM1 protein [Drechmeria coniospora]KYK61208.1 TOM1 protein [Drechmeria coniospora]
MGKITKSMQPKHKETLSPWLRSYVNTTASLPLPSLPSHLATFPSRWPFGRGDLYHWIPLLNRFDSILHHFCRTYGLHEGPQPREFASDLLLNQAKDTAFSSEKQWDPKELEDLGFPPDGDRLLVEAILRFTRMLLEHCGNRSIYASSAHLNDLLNSTSLSVIIATLEVGSELAQRYQASVKRIGSTSRQISAALLANHYNIDLDRIQQLASPFVKTHILTLSDSTPTTTPATTKGKEKAHTGSGRSSASMYASDLVSVATSDDKRWKDWTDIRVFYYPQDPETNVETAADNACSSMPSTPTPLRRSSTMTTQQLTPRSRNVVGDDSSPLGPRTPAVVEEHVAPGQRSFDIPKSAVVSTPIHDLVSRCREDMPAAAKYEVFHRLRVAKALTGTVEHRQQILATRLLAITNLAYIYNESSFVDKVLRQDIDEIRRYQLVYQLAELIHPSADGRVELIVSSRAFDSYFEIFESPAHIRCMETDRDLAQNVGASFDELARHHPPLRTAISNAVIDMVARVRFLGLQKARTAGWGARLFVTGSCGKLLSVSETGALEDASELLAEARELAISGDVDVDMDDAVATNEADIENRDDAQGKAHEESIVPYILALANFLSSYLSNGLLKSFFVKKGGFELLLDICQSPSLPATFGDSAASRMLNSVVSQLVEQSPVRTLPSLLLRATTAIDVLKPLGAQTEAFPPFFAPFLAADLEIPHDVEGVPETMLIGTKLVKALLNAQTFIKIVSDCFCTMRNSTLTFYPVNVHDYYLALVKSIGPLLRGVLAEEAGQLSIVPQHWSLRPQPSAVDSDARDVVTDPEGASLPDAIGAAESWTSAFVAGASASSLTDQEKSSIRFKNYDTLRVLLHPMIPTSFPLFQSIGRSLLPRRSEPSHPEPFTRCRHLDLGKALADSVLQHLAPSVAMPENSSKDFHYWIIMLHTIHEMLIDTSSSLRQSDRSSIHIIMPVLLAFKEQGGLEVINSMLKAFAAAVRQGSEKAAEDSSKAKVAAFGLKKVLDLLYVLVNGKNISDAGNFFNIQPRQVDRAHSAIAFQQIVVEFRSAVLPGIMELWDSNFIDNVPDATVKRLLDILKLISASDHELQQISTTTAPFDLFKYTDARFDWKPLRDVVTDNLHAGYAEDLVHEAAYRANGNVVSTTEYCRAHKDGLAGPRNPIPAEDADTSALTVPETSTNEGDSAANEGEPSAGAPGLSDGDQMSLDALPAELSAEGLLDLMDRPENVDEEQDSQHEPPVPPPSEPGTDADQQKAIAQLVSAKESMDALRTKLRDNLIDQCLDVIRAHPDTAIDVADLITSMVLRRQNHDVQEEVGSTLSFALSSLAFDEEEKKKNGKCIAAYSHLLALLLQDEKFFERNLETLREKVDEYVNFVKVPFSSSTDDLPPWIPYILLILEVLLCHDERPVAAQWKNPKSLEDPVGEAILQLPTPLVDDQQRTIVLESLLELLPRIGKEEVLATAVLRILVILTRRRSAAKLVGEKKNLQRLFVMAKQLSGSGSERLRQTRLTTYIITILRHIIEDEETLKQIMRAEIRADFPSIQRIQRASPDVATYLRTMAPVALRAPDLFVDMTNELLEFSRWHPSSADGMRTQQLSMKEARNDGDGDAKPAVNEAAFDQEVKRSTEAADKEMTDAPKAHHDSKRPVVENPDGVIHFLLCELVNYREVDDKEPPTVGKDSQSDTEAGKGAQDDSSDDKQTSDGKDKKQSKPLFKSEEHPIFVYRCFLLSCLAELLQSYTRTKVEFINFKRSAPPLTINTPIKPRSSILNYLIYDLLCQGNLSGTTDSIASKKKAATSSLTQKVLVALVAKTNERPVERGRDKFAYDDEHDLLFVRKFVLDTILKAYEKTPFTDEPLETRYSRMQCLAELMNHMIGEKDKDQSSGIDSTQSRSLAQLRRLMYEKGFVDKLTSSIAEISLNFPGVKRAIKYILRVLRVLTATAKELSLSSLPGVLPSDPSADDNSDEEFASTSSLSDLDDDREETPDLYRNSTLGMLEAQAEDDESGEENEDDEDDIYGDEYDDDEMDYGDDDISDGQDNISDEDEELSGMGEIEGLHGNPSVVEVIMDDDEDDDDTSDDEDDEGMDSADMEDVDRVEIVDEEGNPLDDDGDSGWESESDVDEDDPDADDLDYEAEVQDDDEAHLHGIDPHDLLDDMARAMMGQDDGYEAELTLDDTFMDENHDEGEDDDGEDIDEEDIDDEEYIYDDDYPDEQLPPMPNPGWNSMSMSPEQESLFRQRQLILLEQQNRRPVLTRMDNRSPFPPRLIAGSHRDQLDFRNYFSRSHRPAGGAQVNPEDGVNPLLRSGHSTSQSSPRTGHVRTTVGVRLPEGVFSAGRHAIDGPMGLLSELMEFLPIMGRNEGGQTFHFHLGSAGGARDARDFVHGRWSRGDQRREGSAQEPHQAVSFVPEPTLIRYQEEARMIFGAAHTAEASKLVNIIVANLTPAAMEREKKIKAEEAEMQLRREEDRKKREEENRKVREAKEAEEKAAREKREMEEREAAERFAAETAASNVRNSQLGDVEADGGAMEGIESTEPATSGGAEAQNTSETDHPQRRVMTTLRGEEVDVTELGIDPDYLAALPEEFREEVVAQTISERRSQAREEAASGESTEVFQEFLDALPEELRLEIAQQERQDERRRQHRRHAAHSGSQTAAATEMDPASILLTFPPELREQALIDQGEDLMDQLPPDLAAQARALVQQRAPVPQHQSIRTVTAPGRTPPAGDRAAGHDTDIQGESRIARRTVVQMLDKSGIATLLRLMFIAQHGSIRNYLFSVFADVCENRQNRLEVVSSILQILQDGSTDMGAVERSFGQLSLKARKHREKEPEQKTPQSLKRTLTTIIDTSTNQTNSETSPLLIVQQCLDLLVDLCTKSHHIPWFFLTEHEIVGSALKRALSRKGKAKDTKAHKYAINSLLTLLDRELVTESSLVMTHLADLLNRVTLPLQNLDRRRKETADEGKSGVAAEDEIVTTGEALGPDGAMNTFTVAEPSHPDGNATDVDSASKDKEHKSSAPSKRPRQLQPPVIPPQNLMLVVRIFVARECNSKTFQNTISTIKNLSAIPGAKEAFGQELVRQAQLLSKNIVSDLDDLLPHIDQASTGTEIQGVALAKFSPGASEQNKLLRVLTALDHLFDSKKKTRGGEDEHSKDEERQYLVNSLYNNPTFWNMWKKLSTCLGAIRQRENMLNVATILLPLIESLMVVCKNTTASSEPLTGHVKDTVPQSPPPASPIANLFFSFTEEHRRILNELVRNNPKLMSGTFALLVQNPKVLEFDNKRNYFNRSVHSRSPQRRPSHPALQLSVRRDQVFRDSFKALYFKSGDEMKFGKLNIRFHGEEGVDAGGVTREWFQVLARQMFDPNYALFIPVSSDRTTFHPNKLSGVNEAHLMFFKFIGRIIGKALYEGRLLDCFFSRAVYKRILGKPVSVKDMESFDPDYYKSLCWMLDNDITDIITETFSVEDDEFGVTNVVDLVPHGREVSVTEENKHEYVRLVVDHKLLSSVKEQMENFLLGFHEIIPANLISIFNEQELELLISGLPDIDVDDWKSNTEYQNYTPSSQQIQWFWRAVRSFDKEERAKLLQFVTGTSKVPLNGFKELEGMNGINRFNIHRDYGNMDRLPSSHTCFNPELDLPEYESYDMLRSQVLKAITQGSEYFGFA